MTLHHSGSMPCHWIILAGHIETMRPFTNPKNKITGNHAQLTILS